MSPFLIPLLFVAPTLAQTITVAIWAPLASNSATLFPSPSQSLTLTGSVLNYANERTTIALSNYLSDGFADDTVTLGGATYFEETIRATTTIDELTTLYINRTQSCTATPGNGRSVTMTPASGSASPTTSALTTCGVTSEEQSCQTTGIVTVPLNSNLLIRAATTTSTATDSDTNTAPVSTASPGTATPLRIGTQCHSNNGIESVTLFQRRTLIITAGVEKIPARAISTSASSSSSSASSTKGAAPMVTPGVGIAALGMGVGMGVVAFL